MSASEKVIAAAVLLLPRARRAVRREEWLADLAGADELGMPRSAVVLGAVRAAIGEGIRSVSPRRVLATAAVALGVVIVGAPVAAFAVLLVSDARGVVTTETAADGTEREVFWRDYPGIPELEPHEVLAAPSLEEGEATGRAMLAEIEAELTARLGLAWAATVVVEDAEIPPAQNYYGGRSMLHVLNVPSRQSTTVPATWAGKEEAIATIAEVAARYGYAAPVLDFDQPWFTPKDGERDLGGPTPATAVLVPGMLRGPYGQWVMFTIRDLALDDTGRFAERFEGSAEHGWLPDSISLMYGTNGLLPADDRDEFAERMAPYVGLVRPEPLES